MFQCHKVPVFETQTNAMKDMDGNEGRKLRLSRIKPFAKEKESGKDKEKEFTEQRLSSCTRVKSLEVMSCPNLSMDMKGKKITGVVSKFMLFPIVIL